MIVRYGFLTPDSDIPIANFNHSEWLMLHIDEIKENIINLFKGLAKQGKCVIVVTHSKNVANMANEKYFIKNGVIV